MNIYRFTLFLILFLSIIILGAKCKDENKIVEPSIENHAPKIQSISITPDTVQTGEQATATCVATDEDGDYLIYTWSANGGTFPNGSIDSSVTWQAPISLFNAGTYTLTCTVSDLEDPVSENVSVTVKEALPETPSDLTITLVSSTEIRLHWTDNSSNEDGFIIERKVESGSFIQIDSTSANTSYYYDTQVISYNNTYTYQVKAYNSSGNSSAASETKIILPAYKDTYISGENPDASYGTVNCFFVGSPGNGGRIGLIAFDVTQVEGKPISTATFYLYKELSGSAYPINIIPLRDFPPTAISNWDENSTWNTAELWDDGVVVGQLNTTSFPAEGIITNIVANWANGMWPNKGIKLYTNSSDQNYWIFYSRESDFWNPVLEIILY